MFRVRLRDGKLERRFSLKGLHQAPGRGDWKGWLSTILRYSFVTPASRISTLSIGGGLRRWVAP
jgi:hypothetical protein